MRFAVLCALLIPGAASAASVSGIVRDQATQQPVAGALVTVQPAVSQTTTAADGSFTLDAPPGLTVQVVAARQGYWNQAQAVVAPADELLLELQAVPVVDDPSYVFAEPDLCRTCHPAQVDSWSGSPMSRAGLNTWVHDIYDGNGDHEQGGFVYLRDSIQASASPASDCAACHEPESWASTPDVPLGSLAAPSTAMRHGVACDLCHRVARIDESKPNFPGIYQGVVQLSRAPGLIVEYGVLADTSFHDDTRMRPAYQPQLPAALCAACHQDKNDPDLDGDFEEANGVISEPTYLEWLASPYADPESPRHATCATCHMPELEESSACSIRSVGRPPGQIRSHRIEGTTPEFLENAATLTVASEPGEGDELGVVVTVTNDQTGHHLPTGVTIRNMLLLVEATDADGQPLEALGDQVLPPLAGEGDPAQGAWAGLPGKMYAVVNRNAAGEGPTFFTDADGVISDTRIPADASDVTHYRFRQPEHGPATVHVRLVYRRSWAVLTAAKGWDTDGHGRPLEDVQAPNFGHLMEEATLTVAAGGGEGCGCAVGGASRSPRALGLVLLVLVALRLRRRVLLLLLVACSGDSTPAAPTCSDFPCQRISDYGLWTSGQTPAPGVIAYAPKVPPFGDHDREHHFMQLPAGATIGYDDHALWTFSEGTILAETHAYPRDARDPAQGERLLETRILRRSATGWQQATYVWDDDQTDAQLETLGRQLELSWVDGSGATVTQHYRVPNKNECGECHQPSERMAPLGVRTRQLEDQVDALAAQGLLEPAPGGDRDHMADPADTAQPLDDRARSYLEANCAHCHNDHGGKGATSGLILMIENQNPTSLGLCKRPISPADLPNELIWDILPGSPEMSVLPFRLGSTQSGTQMPPLPLTSFDADGLALVQSWIAAMPADDCLSP